MVDLADIPPVIRDFFSAHLEVFAPQRHETMRRKSDRTMVGSADEEMHQALSKFLAERFPLPMVSEEQEHAWPPPHDRFWLIDPRDGSNNAAAGMYPLVGSMVSLIENGDPVLSCIFVPVEERDCRNGFYFAVRDGGAWRWESGGPVRIGVSETHDIHAAMMLIEGPSRKVAADSCIRKLQQEVAWRIGFTCAWAFTRLASGFVDILVSAHNKPTDSLHGILFVREAGGTVTDFDGNMPTLVNCANVLYSNKVLHQNVLDLLHA